MYKTFYVIVGCVKFKPKISLRIGRSSFFRISLIYCRGNIWFSILPFRLIISILILV